MKILKKLLSFSWGFLLAGLFFYIIYLFAFVINVFTVPSASASECPDMCIDQCPNGPVLAFFDSMPWGTHWCGSTKIENDQTVWNGCESIGCPGCNMFYNYSCSCTEYQLNPGDPCGLPYPASVQYIGCCETSGRDPVGRPSDEMLVCGNPSPCPNCSHINQFTCECDSTAPECGHRDLLPNCSCGCLSSCEAPFIRDPGWCNCYCPQGIDYYIDLKDCKNNPTWNVNGSDPFGYGRLDSSPAIMQFHSVLAYDPLFIWGAVLDPLVSCEVHAMGCMFYPEWNETDCDIDNGIVGYVGNSSFLMSSYPLGYYMFHCPSIPANCDSSRVTDDSNVFYWNPVSLIDCEGGCTGENCPPTNGKDAGGFGISYFTNSLKRGSKSVGHGGNQKRDNP